MSAIMLWVERVSLASTIASGVANILPDARYLNGYPRAQKVYATAISLVSATALNIRAQLPALGVSILGFKQCASCGGSSTFNKAAASDAGGQTIGDLKPGQNPYFSSVPPSGTSGSSSTNPTK